ncbi:NYN domain-containing protein [Paenibacillus pasadenensis]|uniref:RNA-binding protein n=1 Tax=Paenibacillus pasadenensis TaxID=217090 RepID=A0A2N5N1D0_9BACL|nr:MULTISPECIES: NYN domain-containing protein [Paenibacillus]PLT44133.1 hypothetical protein B8V81_2564 [Paenibacillus pasadenensis]QGG54661.1 NYN domain-containing protein [Paenibacillus sp. B01]
MARQPDVLLVDGYNIIGAWPELERLKEANLEEARERLLHLLADYQGFTGMEVYVVFDAHQVAGSRSAYKQHKITVVFTKEKETADECIERLSGELRKRSRSIYVATSDSVEQHVAFGKGALRLSARELQLELDQNRRQIARSLKDDTPKSRNTIDGNLSLDARMKLERMRRGE